jgi:hypothetical protein
MNTWKTILTAVALMIALCSWWLHREALTSVPPASDCDSSGQEHASASRAASTQRSALRDLLIKLIKERKAPPLTAEQIRAFVEKQGRSPSSLLAAWRLGGGDDWLEEAASRFPENPQVALAKISMARPAGAGAEIWVERLKRNDPENATGWCYEALARLQGGDSDSARAALAQAAGSRRLDGYLKESQRTVAEAYRSAGYEGIEAELYSCAQESTPLAGVAREMQHKMLTSGTPYDGGLIHDLLAFSKLVRRSTETPLFITHAVGLGMEESLLTAVGTHEMIPGTNKLVLERLGEIDREKATIADLRQKGGPAFLSADESELKQFLRRRIVDGDMAAIQWLISRHPER